MRAVILVAGMLALAGCDNTVSGLGADMESAGRNMQGDSRGVRPPPPEYQRTVPAYPNAPYERSSPYSPYREPTPLNRY